MNFENLKHDLKISAENYVVLMNKKIAKILSANNLKPTILSW